MTPNVAAYAKLDPREQRIRIPSHRTGLALFLRHLPPPADNTSAIVLYVHGATFPSALSVAHRFDNRSWRDELCAAGFHVWGLDFHGYGGSDPFPEMSAPADASAPLGRAEDASLQIEQAARHILRAHQTARLSIIAHSWGTLAAGRFALRCPDLVDRLVFFGPIAARAEPRRPGPPGWRIVTVQEQWERFVADTPPEAAPVLHERHFRPWAESYLDGDPESRSRLPAGVKTPLGPLQDILDAWSGTLAYNPALIEAPVGIIRGEWDSTSSETDATWLFGALSASRTRRLVTIARAGHLMHLEDGRYALYRETEAFLRGGDAPPLPSQS